MSRPGAPAAARAGGRSTWDMLIWNHVKLWVAALVGVILVFVLPSHWTWICRVLIGWNGAMCVLVPLTYIWMRKLDARALRAKYREEDPTAPVILLVTVIGALLSVMGIVALLSTAKEVPSGQRVAHLILATMTIVNSWALVHTMFTIRYADMFYSVPDGKPPVLSFPDTAEPLFWDFVYFSFTIGVACQTADVSTRHTDIRRVVTIHSVIAFVFNLAVLGFALNVSAGLLNGN
ncbi:MAG TPA: DUF1345 domain-containing protein [Steroidobacteraceae bacterium]|nr:DUF1345 domain-containing protein [Steroidobacteraceae bacterium]